MSFSLTNILLKLLLQILDFFAILPDLLHLCIDVLILFLELLVFSHNNLQLLFKMLDSLLFLIALGIE